ncbi:LPD38 domain-containing protein [uncultured Psychrosphaera sp.]|uniref:LPD38 domain-containing protein n=1 Tax=uncultured Psychrosphaera sp. TaxID=1403522 RepID=UPI002629E3FC|nr:LPD38 domain-containing protein [uncultured Psychrosphaera sp.]
MINTYIDPFSDEKINFIDPFVDDKGGLKKAFGAGVDKVQELSYRAVKGFAESGVDPSTLEDGSLDQRVAETIGQGSSLSNWAQEGIDRNIEEQKEYEPTISSYKDIESVGDFGSYAGELIVGSVPTMATAATGVGAFGMAVGLSEEAYSKQPETEKSTIRATASGFGQMALERLGIKHSLGDVGKSVIKDGFIETAKKLKSGDFVNLSKDKNFILDIIKGSTGEGLTEAGQEALAQWGAGKDISEIDKLDEAFVGGFVAGGVMRSTTESAQHAMKWQQKSAPIAKNGIQEMVNNGIAQDEAIDTVRTRLIEAGVNRGLSEIESRAVASRTLKQEFGISDEIFGVFEADSELKQLEPSKLEQVDLDENSKIEQNHPEFFEALKQQEEGIDYDIPTAARKMGAATDVEVSKVGDMLTSPSQQSLQDLEQHSAPSVQDMVNAAPLDKSPTPEDRFSPIKFQHEGEVIAPDQTTQELEQLPGATFEGEVVPDPKQVNAPFKQIQDKDIIFAPDNSGVIVKHDNSAFDSELEALKSIQARKAIRAGYDVEPTKWGDGFGLKVIESSPEPEPINNQTLDETAPNEGAVFDPAESNLSTENVDKVVDKNIATEITANSEIDLAAHEAATSPSNDLAEPTEAQKEANNYKLGRLEFEGMKIGIENPQGSKRSGIDPNGQKWSVDMQHHYGDITGTKGADGDAIDVFIKPDPQSGKPVFIVDQVDPVTGKFDEHKVMMGFDSIEEAKQAYLSNYDKDWKGLGNISPVNVDEFKQWTKGETTKPFAEENVTNSEFGPVYTEFKHDAKGAIEKLKQEQSGEAIAAISHHELGDIDLVWGKEGSAKSDGFGLAKLVKYHPEVVDDLQNVINSMKVIKKTKNRAQLESKDHKGSVRLTWDNKKKHWLLTAFKKRGGDVNTTSTDIDISKNKDDTASLDNVSNKSITPKSKTGKIDDFGEVLHDAAKHNYTISEKFDADIDVRAEPLSKSFPIPDYKKLNAEGVDKRVLAFISHLRHQIPSKPRQAGKLDRWSQKVSDARHMSSKLLEIGKNGPELLIDGLNRKGQSSSVLKNLHHVLDIAKDIEPDRINELAKYTIVDAHFTYFRGEENVNKWVVTDSSKKSGFGGMSNQQHFDTVEQAQEYIKQNVTESFESNGKKLSKFDIWSERGKPGVIFLGKKLAPNKFIELKQFQQVNDARAYILDNNTELVELLKEKRKLRAVRRSDNNPRIGIDHRDGENVTPEKFDSTFGFRGVQFGNWVEGGKRQDDLNNAFDGLMDLSNLLNVPPKALSLNGELGLAFGARGRGGINAAMAHFEPDQIVINLTKKQGAGSLAHEWFHALDNYFARMDKLDSGDKKSGEYMSEHNRKRGVLDKNTHKWREATPDDFDVRGVVYDAFKGLKKSIETETELAERSAKADGTRSKDYWGTVREMTARTFERYVIEKLTSSGYQSDYLANIVDEDVHNKSNELFGTDEPYLYPLASEMEAVTRAYDNLFNTLKTKKTDKGVMFYRQDNPSTSIVKNDSTPKGMPLNIVQNIANDFIASYNGNLKLDVQVKNTQQELYGSEVTVEKYGRIKGVYDSNLEVLTLAADNISSVEDIRATLRHEILGHYALDTFKESDKQSLFSQIIASQKDPSLKDVWNKIKSDKFYSTQPINVQAEEVFAFTIENGRNKVEKLFDYIQAWLSSALRKVGLAKGQISASEIRNLADRIAKQIKAGKRNVVDNNHGNTKLRTEQEVNERFDRIVIPDETLQDRVIRTIQDKFQRLLVIQRKLPSVNENNDAYLAEEAFHGKAGNAIHELQIKHVEEIPKIMAQHELTQDEVDLYLIAKHASERNAYINKINPELNGAGSGMSNADAESILNKAVLEGKHIGLEAVSDKVQEMLSYSRELMIKHGLETNDVVENWQSQYKNYVPLKGYAKEEGSKDSKGRGFKSGSGFNIKGRETIRAMGRRSLAESPLLHTINDTTQAIIRAHKNDVGNTFLKLVNDNPDPDLWEVFTESKPDMKRGRDKDGNVVIVKMSAYEMKQSDDYFKTKVDGVEQFIKIHDPLLNQAMNNLGVDQMNGAVQLLSKFTRTLSALVTMWNPEFMLTNFARDIQAAVANMITETQVSDGKALNSEKMASKMVKSIPQAMGAMRRALRNDDYEGKNAQQAKFGSYVKEFLEAGSKTGWVNQKSVDELAGDLKGAIGRENNTVFANVKKSGMVVADFVADYNEIVENATRFSAYYHAREQGVSVKQAASLSKNLTINFNRKGEISNTLNAFFMFANASVQGTTNMLRALATPKDRSKSMWNPKFYNLSQKLAIGAVGATVMMASLMREIGGEDEDGVPFYDKVPDHVKATNFVLMLGDGDYFAFPMPYGYNVLAAMGHSIDGAIQGKSVGSASADLVMAAMGAFSPVGVQSSSDVENGWVRTISPTVIKPFVEMAVNENFFGGQIYPSQSGYGAQKSDSHLGNKYTWEWSKNLATWMNDITGGDQYLPGAIDVAPQSIDHLVKFMGGGVLQFASRWQNLASKAVDDKEITKNDIPFSRRFYKQLNPKASIGEFYDAKDLLNKYQANFKSLHGEKRNSYRNEFSNELKLQKFSASIEKQLRQLNKVKRTIEASKLSSAQKESRVSDIEDKKLELVLKFSKMKHELGLKYL